MAIMVNSICKQEGETYNTEPIMVTITLEEYRSLVEENAKMLYENEKAIAQINSLFAEKEDIKRQWENERKWRDNNK